MRGKSFLILLVLALGLGGYAYFVESKKDLTTTADPARQKLFTVDSEKIDQLTVKSASGDVTTLRKDGGAWTIVSPAGLPTDTAEVSAITTALAGVESESVVDDNAPSLAEYSLDPARIRIEFSSGGQSHTLDLGVKTPTGSDLYARIDGQKKVVLVGAYREDAFNKSTFNLRDKTILTFDRDKVDAVTIAGGKAPLEFARKNNQWRITSPLDAAADFPTLDSLIGRVYQLRMKSFVADAVGADAKKYGFDKPQYQVTIAVGADKRELIIGGKASETDVYARDAARPAVFTVEGNLVDDLKRPATEYRLKDVFEFRTFTATELDITRGGQTYTFVRTSPPADGQTGDWKLSKPTDKPIEGAKAGDLLTNFSNLHADSFVDTPAAGTEEATITAKFGNTSETVTFRSIPAKDKTAQPTIQAVRKGEKGAMVVAALDFDRAMALFKELAGAK